MTQIAKALKNNRGIKDPEIVFEDKVGNRKLVYKIVCKEDVQVANAQAPIFQPSSSSESSEDEDDSEEIRSKSRLVNNHEVMLNPQDVLKMTSATILNKKRKR